MWKEYSLSYIKNNRSSGLSVRLAAFISALLLSLLCGLFYNAWKYEVERIELTEGGWHSRLIGELGHEEIETIRNFANVKDVAINTKESKGTETTVDLYFDDMRAVLSDTPHIAEAMGISPEKAVYHYELLAMYLIRSENDAAPRLLFPMYILITALASFSLIVIIHNSFAVSMNARIHQFGIFSSIGATPKQIRACLLQEAAALCAMPILAGNLLGIGGSIGLIHLSNVLLRNDIPGRHKAVPGYHPLVLVLTLAVTAVTVWISAWLPARKLSRLTPLEAIRNTGELQLKRKKKSRILALLFGVEGELAGNALKAQKKALRTASLSLIFSFMAFTVMQCFFTLSGISTRETYFEKYQDAWDIMVTVRGAEADTFDKTEAVQGLAGVESAVVYQKAEAKTIIAEKEMSDEMKAFGGFSHASGSYVTKVDGGWLVNAPVVILDDSSFMAYCEQIGIAPGLSGAVVRNQIRDVTNPDFRHPEFVPYIKEPDAGEDVTRVLFPVMDINMSDGNQEKVFSVDTEVSYGNQEEVSSVDAEMSYGNQEEIPSKDTDIPYEVCMTYGGDKEVAADIPVLSYTDEVPVLREEYATIDYYELVHFIPVSLWREIKGQTGGAEEELYIRVLAREDESLENLNTLQSQIHQLVGQSYLSESENRIQEYEANDKQLQGMMVVLGGFCVLLALIGIGDIFSNTLGFVRQRKREFARYMSVGLTPGEIRKMFCIEALVLAGRPILITLPLAVVAVGYMLKMSYLGIGEFMAEAPLVPIMVFMLAILASVALAYGLAWRGVGKISLAEVLKDDTMM